MEDGGSMSDQTKNGVVAPIMANFPEGQVAVTPQEITKLPPEIQEIKVNGDSELKNPFDDQDDSSECSDVLVIDESVKPNIKKSKKKLNDCSGSSEVITHSNPYFNESIFELSQLHQQQNDDVQEPPPIVTPPDIASVTSGLTDITITKIENPVVKPVKGKRGKGKPKPKLREYAQYLGLQPTVQFKCSKCGRAGFESLTTLQEHALQCDAIQNIAVPHQNSYSGFKLTRKVFLCSACGTYYENWNLYMHMLEFHRRYICLYCLGMFSVLEDLCQHIQTKHNLEPGFKNSLDEFFNVYNEPCYITCCECNKLFSEQDNFFYHNCVNNKNKTKLKTTPSVVNKPIRPENHVTGETTAILTNSDNNKKSEEKSKVTNVVEENQDNCVTEVIKTSNSNEIAPPSPTQPSNEEEEMNGNHTPTPVMSEEETITTPPPPPIETRKVPKLSLKLPKKFIDSEEEPEPELDHDEEESDDSEKLTMELEQQPIIPQLQIAGPDIAIIELELEQPLDKFDIRVLLQKCLKATAPTCIYCNHARKIAVNGKQLGLHAIAEHRFAAIVNSITAEELIPESFNNRIQENLDDLSTVFFNLESSVDPGEAVTFSHIFECFPCRYSTAIHKELYLHNRKMHAKNLLLCIMCKSNFYSYSELVCHLCPGLYVLDYDIQFRCCMCVSDDLPSAFRLMVHLRKRHHVCDVCLEMCHNQYRLSNHVWKHKLHHFCYRCGIAYRNKPDITRHLFWKHGTESVLCKKCLQKKWPHVYHFCVPPSSFACEECNLSFTRAVSLKVHKRIHSGEKKHKCTFEECEEMFISKKLMLRHEETHREPPIPVVPVVEEKVDIKLEEMNEERDSNLVDKKMDVIEEVEEEKPVVKPKVDVYDLPELNLSESDSSDSESETVQKANTTLELPTSDVKKEMDSSTLADPTTVEENPEDIEKSSMTIETIWDNFKNYQANKKKIDDMFGDVEKTIQSPPTDQQETSSIDLEKPEEEKPITSEQALLDHDYCIDPNRTQLEEQDNSINEIKPDLMNERVDHDYCSPKLDEKPEKKPAPTATSSDSSSDSDSSSCSCGSNCSCSSSSSKSSSSSSDSSGSDSSTEEGRRRQEARKLRRKERSNLKKKQDKEKKLEATQSTEQPIQQPQQPVVITPIEIPIRESDLDTTESETDEEFYDKQPQKLAKKLLEEKRNQLLAEVGPLIPNGTTFIESTSQPPTPPSYVEEEQVKPKKKSKSKKRKKRRSERREEIEHGSSNIPMPVQTVSPITLSLRNSPVPVSDSSLAPISPVVFSKSAVEMGGGMLSRQDSNDSMLRASKRIRVRNKFYGYSSDEEQDKVGPSMAKWRKVEVPSRPQSPKVVPPITIKTGPLPPLPQQPQQPIIPQLPQPTVEPISIRMNHPRPPEIKPPRRTIPPIRLMPPRLPENKDSGSDSNDSSSEEPHHPMPIPRPVQPPITSPRANQPQLYCYCRCPYDEVSEMIGCDSSDCAIEWFHFECVGIMVPPKGQWFCPDCRKKKQQRRELMQA